MHVGFFCSLFVEFINANMNFVLLEECGRKACNTYSSEATPLTTLKSTKSPSP